MAGMASILFHLNLYFIPNGPKIDNLAALQLTIAKQKSIVRFMRR